MTNKTTADAACARTACPAPLLAADDVAELLHISRTTLYRLVDLRSIAFYRISGSLRFSVPDIEDYLRRTRIASVDKQSRL